MLFVNQRDYPDVKYRTRTDVPEDPYGQNTTVKSSACGLASAMMALDRLYPSTDVSFTMEDALNLSYEVGANHGYGTDAKLFYPAFAEKFGLEYETTNDVEAVKECLRTGGTAIALVGDRSSEGYVSVFTHSEHYVCLTSVVRDGRFEVLDPNLYDGKFEEEGREGKAELTGNLARCSEKVLLDEVEKIVRRSEATPEKWSKAFHLFWRI
jgi:hypothetical protein